MNRMGLVVGTMLLAGSVAWGVGTLEIGELKVEGNQVIVPIVLGGEVGSGVAAMDFRLRYDPDQFQPVSASPGLMAARADKQVMANVQIPGEYVVVVMGQRTTCRSGEVVQVVMNRVGEAEQAVWGLGLHGQTLSSAEGAVIDSRVVPFNPARPPSSSDGDEEGPEAEDGVSSAAPPVAAPLPNEPADSNRAGATPTGAVAAPAPPGTDEPAGKNESGDSREQLARAMAEAARVRASLDTPPEGKAAPEARLRDEAAEEPPSEVLESGPAEAEAGEDSEPVVSRPMRMARAPSDATTVEPNPDSNAGDAPPGGAHTAAAAAPPGNQGVKGAALAAALVLGAAVVWVARRRLFG